MMVRWLYRRVVGEWEFDDTIMMKWYISDLPPYPQPSSPPSAKILAFDDAERLKPKDGIYLLYTFRNVACTVKPRL